MMFTKDTDPCLKSLIDVHFLEGIVPEAVIYHDMYISKDIFIRAVVIDSNGVFFFVPVLDAKEDHSHIAQEIRRYFGLSQTNSFFFFADTETASFNNIPIDDMYSSLENLYDNLFLPYDKDIRIEELISPLPVKEKPGPSETVFEYKGEKYVIPEEEDIEDQGMAQMVIDTDKALAICDMCEKLEENLRPDAEHYVDEEGYEYIKRYSDKAFGLVGEKQWFKVSDEDTDKIVFMAAVGGWLGLHKFYCKQILEGLTYLLTCGCMGIFPLMDIFMMIMGSYSYKEEHYIENGRSLEKVKSKIYLRKPIHKLRACLCLGLCVVVSAAVAFFLYRSLYVILLSSISDSIGFH